MLFCHLTWPHTLYAPLMIIPILSALQSPYSSQGIPGMLYLLWASLIHSWNGDCNSYLLLHKKIAWKPNDLKQWLFIISQFLWIWNASTVYNQILSQGCILIWRLDWRGSASNLIHIWIYIGRIYVLLGCWSVVPSVPCQLDLSIEHLKAW